MNILPIQNSFSNKNSMLKPTSPMCFRGRKLPLSPGELGKKAANIVNTTKDSYSFKDVFYDILDAIANVIFFF